MLFCNAGSRNAGHHHRWTPPADQNLIGRLFPLWRNHPNQAMRNVAEQALATMRQRSRRDVSLFSSVSRRQIASLLRGYEKLDGCTEQPAALVIAWYLCSLNDIEIARRAAVLLESKELDLRICRTLTNLMCRRTTIG